MFNGLTLNENCSNWVNPKTTGLKLVMSDDETLMVDRLDNWFYGTLIEPEYSQTSLRIMNGEIVACLIYGWFRKHLHVLSEMPPDVILQIVGCFWWDINLDYFQDVWCTGEVFWDQQDRFIMNKDDSDTYFKFERHFKIDNIWIYNFKVQHMDQPICIGVCDNSMEFDQNWFAGIDTGYGIAITGGFCLTYVRVRTVIGNQAEYIPQNKLSPCGTEMEIKVIVNRKAKFVKFIVDGLDLGIAFFIGNKENSIKSFSIAVRMNGKNQSIKLCANEELNFDNPLLNINDYEAKIICKVKSIWCRNEWIDYSQRETKKKRKNSDECHLCIGEKSYEVVYSLDHHRNFSNHRRFGDSWNRDHRK